MGVNQKKYNSDRKLNLRLYDNALQFCTAHNDTGESILKHNDFYVYMYSLRWAP